MVLSGASWCNQSGAEGTSVSEEHVMEWVGHVVQDRFHFVKRSPF